MTAEVIDLPVITRLDLDPQRVIEAASKAGMTEVVIVGLDADGCEYFAASQAQGPDALWHLERAKWRLMQMADEMRDDE